MPRETDRTSHSTRRERRAERGKRGVPARPTDVRALFELAVHEHRSGNLARARTLYEQILQSAASPQVTCNLATVLRAQGHLAEAEARYREALAAKPDFAEAHGGLGNVLRDTGHLEESLAAYATALDQSPDYSDAHVNAGNVLQGLGRYEEAAAHFEAALAKRPDDEETRFTLAAIRGEQRDTAPSAYTRNLFDSYAERFDHHLVQNLQYHVPGDLADSVRHVLGDAARDLRVVDLGCGTGLCAEAIAPLAHTIHGVDLAPRMVAKARERGIYEEVACADIVSYLQTWHRTFDVALAGDVFIYVGDMAPALRAARNALVPGGVMAFSVERLEGQGFALQSTARFAHAPGYVENAARAAGFAVCLCNDIAVRIDRGRPLRGLVYVLRAD